MSKLIKWVAIACLSMGLMACTSGPLDQGQQYFKTKNYRAAFEHLYPLAMEGNAEAQYAVGYILFYGLDGTKDRDQGVKWIQKSAMQNYAPAKNAWGMISQQMSFTTVKDSQAMPGDS